ncbi:MAG: LPS-assembly protein LptD [Prevotellaceae bacterium]|nr:LPS-assembly protein LptD [Prevotellaceae bacterium]
MFTNLNRHLAFFVLTLTCLASRAQVSVAENMQASPALPDSGMIALPDSGVIALPDSGAARDSLFLADSLATPDSALVDSTISENAITDPVTYSSEDSTVYDLTGGEFRVMLYGNAKVTSLDMEITGDYINFNRSVNTVFTRGTYDTATHAVKGKPVFKQGSETFEMDSMYFNLSTKKAKIYAVITQQSDGYLHGEEIKRMPDNVIYVAHGKFTACDAERPHYYFSLSKAKVIPNDKTIAGPAYFVLEDVPTPLFIPFFITPKTASRASGVIIPSYGEETNRGFYFREGGYYFAFNDYMDITLTGDIYTLGSWRVSSRAAYLWKYHFSGGFNINYAYNVVGEPGSADYNPSTAFSLQWNHSQDPKFSPNKTFSASVNFTSSSYRRYNETSLNESLTNTTQSSISYSQVWPGTPFSMSMAATHSHNTRDSIITLGLPTLTFNMARITPFKRKERVGPVKWYENIGIPLSVNMQNTVTAKETEFGDMDNLIKRRMRNGVRYNTSLSVPFPVAKFINFTPSISYNGRAYFSHINQTWVDTAGRAGYVRRDTVYGFSHDYDFSTSASASTMIYGMFTLGKWSPVQAVRHVISPSVSIGWRPDFSDPVWGIYHDVKVDSTGRTQRYSQHQNGIYGTAGSGKNASLSFGLGNTLEMKVRSKSDTTGTGSKKIKLLEALNFSASYNLLADSMNLSNIGFSGRTTLLGTLGVSFNGVLNPYALNSDGRTTKYWHYARTGKPARLTSFGFSFGYSFNRSEKVTNALPHPVVSDLDPMGEYDGMQVSYVDFTLPWSLSFSYSFSYSKPAFVPTFMQTLNFNGSVSLTPKWAFTFQSGYDLDRRRIAPTSVSLNRDLHCWMFSFSWVPIGSWKSWNFTINAKSAMLRDLKYDRRQSRFDQQPIE